VCHSQLALTSARAPVHADVTGELGRHTWFLFSTASGDSAQNSCRGILSVKGLIDELCREKAAKA
jgi:hypothetical protein